MKLVHAADLHLDSPLLGLERYEGAPVQRLRNATREALSNLTALCVEEGADLLLIAGDLYDGGWRDYSTGLYFASQMTKLREAGVRVVWLRGNHDASSQLMKQLDLPENVRELGSKKPATLELCLGREDLAVHGQGFATRDVTDNLVLGYPEPRPGAVNIGLLHTALGGRPGHDLYAPCSLEDLVHKGYDYWALGHVHQREVLSEDPFVVFPGNLQGRHAREIGPKGASLVTIEGGRVRAVEHRSLDVVRWSLCTVDVSESPTAADAIARVEAELSQKLESSEGRLIATRVLLHGASAAHAALSNERERWVEQIRELATDLGRDEIWLEKVRFATRDRVSIEDLLAHDDAVAEVFRGLRELSASDEALLAIGAELGELARKLPAALREGPEPIKLDSPEELRAVLADVEQMLLPRLTGEPP